MGFRGQAIQRRHSRDRGSKGRCHGNQFWDCISCKWTLTEDNDIRLSCKGWFVISHLWRWELLQTGDCQVGNCHVNCQHSSSLWSPYGIGQSIIFLPFGFFFFFFMAALCNRGAIIFLPCSFFPSSSFFFSSPNLIGRRSDVCHTSTHGIAIVRI